jgi:hypothetical protein
MTFLAPGFLYASLVVAAAVVALHFIVTRQPRAGILPTARFVPDLPANATARATRPSDLLLMLLRVLLVLAAGAGLAKPVVKPNRVANARVILMDLSRAATDSAALRDSVLALHRDQDAVVLFDSSARIVSAGTVDSIHAAAFTTARGNLSAALIAAMRAGSSLRDRADSIELVIVSPLAAEEFDAATDSIRALWRGRARVVSLRRFAPDTARAASKLEVRGAAGDPLQVTAVRARDEVTATGLILRSSSLTASDANDRAVIHWPVVDRPPGAVARSARDTIGGVIAHDALVVSAFERRWTYPSDSTRGAEVVARWIDGEPAAIETPSSTGCARSVSIPVSPIGDLVIRRDFIRFVAAISGNCASRAMSRAADPQLITRLAGSGRLASRDGFRPRGDIHSPLAPWLLALAIAAAIAELFVRRRRSVDARSIRRSTEPEKRAA